MLKSLKEIFSKANYEAERDIIVSALKTVPKGYSQAIDGLRCEPNVINLSNKQFIGGLRLAVNQGLVVRGRNIRSVLDSYDGTTTYKLKEND